MNAIILAGGKSTRMQLDKAFIKMGGKLLIKSQISLLKRIFKQIIVVTNNPDKYRKFKGIKIIQDIIPGRGPLSGIHAGLLASGSFYNFVFACDMPFINQRLIKYMMTLKKDFDVVVPLLKKGYDPLFAIYSKNCLKPITQILNSGNLRVRALFKKIKLKELREEEIEKFGDPTTLFMNINTSQDLCRISISPKK